MVPMKLLAFALVLCAGSSINNAHQTVTTRSTSEERMLAYLNAMSPDLHMNAFLDFFRNEKIRIAKKKEEEKDVVIKKVIKEKDTEIKKKEEEKDVVIKKVIKEKDAEIKKKEEEKDDEIKKVIKKKDAEIKKLIDRNEDLLFLRFVVSSCVIRGRIDKIFKNLVSKSPPVDLASLGEQDLVVPPPEIQGQAYNKSHESWLADFYKTWYSFIKYNDSSFAECLRQELLNTGYSVNQVAWSAPKSYKFYNRYALQEDSPAVVGYEKYLQITALSRKLHANNNQIGKHEVLSNMDEYEIFRMIHFEHKSFLDILEARNTWFITKEDCDVINIIQTCYKLPEFRCQPFKMRPDLVVPIFQDSYSESYNLDECSAGI